MSKPENHESIDIEYVDTPMTCCGLGMGARLTEAVNTGKIRKRLRWDNTEYADPVYRTATKDDVRFRLEKLKEYAEDSERNCAMITVSSAQQQEPWFAKDAAEEAGFKVIHEFFNPNSDNQVYIMVYTRYADESEYRADKGYDKD